MPKENISEVYIEMAHIYAQLSYAKRRKVGAILVKDNRIVSTGYNGTPTGMDNECETPENITKPEVVHAEINAILFAARNGQSTDGCTLYLTLSPCVECAKAIIQSGIKRVIYSETYRCTDGLKLLFENHIKLDFLPLE